MPDFITLFAENDYVNRESFNNRIEEANAALTEVKDGAAAAEHTHTAAQVGAVPNTRKINTKVLSADITLSAGDVGAAAASHTHDAGSITSGTLPVARGGTGATDIATARSNLGVTPANIGAALIGHNHDTGNITSGTLPVARGGTGQTSVQALRNSMGLGNTTSALPVANGGTGATSLGSITVGNSTKWGNYAVSKLTQAQYNALGTKDGNTVYLIVG